MWKKYWGITKGRKELTWSFEFYKQNWAKIYWYCPATHPLHFSKIKSLIYRLHVWQLSMATRLRRNHSILLIKLKFNWQSILCCPMSPCFMWVFVPSLVYELRLGEYKDFSSILFIKSIFQGVCLVPFVNSQILNINS